MRRLLVLVLSLILVGAFANASTSDAKQSSKHAKSSSAMEATIQSVNFAKNTIVVQADNQTKTLRINGDTQFRSAGKDKAVTLKAGDKVLVWMDKDSRDKDTIKKLEVLAPETGSAAGASSEQ